MFKNKGNHHSSLVRLGLILTAVGVLPLASAVAPTATASNSGDAVLVSAAGNVIGPADGPNIELAAVYYHGWYSTLAACDRALKSKIATGQYNFGGCSPYNQYPHKNTYQLWLDEDDCTDRVAPTSINAASVPQTRPLAEA